MRQRSFIVVAVALAVLILGSVGVYAYDKTQSDEVAHGISAGGVDIGGMSKTRAKRELDDVVAAALNKPVVVTYRRQRFKMTPAKAGIRVDTAAMVQQALDESHKGFIFSRAARELTGGSVHANVPVDVSYSKGAVSGFVARLEHRVDQPPQSASLDFSGGTLSNAHSHYGRRLDAQSLTLQINNKLAEPSAARTIAAPVDKIKPKVTTAQLARQYPRVITINRSGFRLTLWHDLKPVKTYPIAVGMQGLETPAGRYSIQDKQVDPSWHVPNSAWAGKLAGQ